MKHSNPYRVYCAPAWLCECAMHNRCVLLTPMHSIVHFCNHPTHLHICASWVLWCTCVCHTKHVNNPIRISKMVTRPMLRLEYCFDKVFRTSDAICGQNSKIDKVSGSESRLRMHFGRLSKRLENFGTRIVWCRIDGSENFTWIKSDAIFTHESFILDSKRNNMQDGTLLSSKNPLTEFTFWNHTCFDWPRDYRHWKQIFCKFVRKTLPINECHDYGIPNIFEWMRWIVAWHRCWRKIVGENVSRCLQTNEMSKYSD